MSEVQMPIQSGTDNPSNKLLIMNSFYAKRSVQLHNEFSGWSTAISS